MSFRTYSDEEKASYIEEFNVLNCWRSGRYHIKEINLINILENGTNLL